MFWLHLLYVFRAAATSIIIYDLHYPKKSSAPIPSREALCPCLLMTVILLRASLVKSLSCDLQNQNDGRINCVTTSGQQA